MAGDYGYYTEKEGVAPNLRCRAEEQLWIWKKQIVAVMLYQFNKAIDQMATSYKRITTNDTQPKNKGTYLTKENWEVMKPFVNFAVKALGVVASAIFVIVRLVPKAFEHQPEPKKNDKVIKI